MVTLMFVVSVGEQKPALGILDVCLCFMHFLYTGQSLLIHILLANRQLNQVKDVAQDEAHWGHAVGKL